MSAPLLIQTSLQVQRLSEVTALHHMTSLNKLSTLVTCIHAAVQALQRKVPPASGLLALKEHMLQTQVSLSEDLRYWITPRDPEWAKDIQWLPLVQGG